MYSSLFCDRHVKIMLLFTIVDLYSLTDKINSKIEGQSCTWFHQLVRRKRNKAWRGRRRRRRGKKWRRSHDGTVVCYHDILLVVLYCCVVASLNLLGRLARCPCIARNIKMHLYEYFYLVREKDERGKALFANVEGTAYIVGWQAHHHHQLYLL